MPEPTPDTTATGTARLGRGLEPDVTIDDLPDPTAPPRKEFTGALRPFAILDRGLGWFEAFILTAGVLLMAVNSVGNVIGRFVFGAASTSPRRSTSTSSSSSPSPASASPPATAGTSGCRPSTTCSRPASGAS
jgi:hypothetical protein